MPQPEPTLGKQFVAVGSRPVYIAADGSGSVEVLATNAVVYYGPAASVTAITGTDLQPLESVTLTAGQWFVCSVESRVIVQDAQSTRVGTGGGTTTPPPTLEDLLEDPKTQDFSLTDGDAGKTIPIRGEGEVRCFIADELSQGVGCQFIVQGASLRLVLDSATSSFPVRSLVFASGDSFSVLKRETTDGSNVIDLLDLPVSGAALVAGTNTFTNTNVFSSIVDISATSGTLKLFGKTVYWGTETSLDDVATAYPNAVEGSWFVTVPSDGADPYILGEMLDVAVVSPPAAPAASVTPLFEGSMIRGNGLSVYQGTWTDTESLAWQWQRETGVSTGVFADITGQSGSVAYQDGAFMATYTTVAADDGLKIRVRVTGTGDGGSTTVTAVTSGSDAFILISAPVVAVDVEKFHTATITASTTKGARTDLNETYVATNAVDSSDVTRWSSFFDSQAVPAVPGANGEWLRADMGSPKLIKRVEINWFTSFATQYEIQTSNDALFWTTVTAVTTNVSGWVITPFAEVTARYVRVLGVTRNSTQFGISILNWYGYGSDDDTGANETAYPVVLPVITGTAQVGQTLTCDDGTWQYPDGTFETVGPFTRQWVHYNANLTFTDIPGANAKTWLTTATYQGDQITCRVGFGSVSTLANPSVLLQPAPSQTPVAPTVTTNPSLPASALVGGAIQVNPGTYAGTPTPTVTRQWQQFVTGAWANISSQTGTSYTPASTNPLRVVETATNTAGSVTGTSNSVTPTAQVGTTRNSFAWPFAGSYPASPFSPFNTSFSDGATFEASGTGKTATWLGTGTNVNSNNGYGMRLDQARSTDPSITIRDGNNGDAFLVTIKAPSAAVPLAGSDGNLNIVEPNGLYVDTFWRMVQISSGVYRTYRWVRNYIRDNAAGQRYDGIGGGIRASGFSTGAGIFRYHHIQDGECPSACVVAVGRAIANTSTKFVWPANTSDGYSYDGGSSGMSMGDRFGIPWATSQPAGLGPAGIVLFTMAQTFGFYVGDTLGTTGSTGVIMVAEPAIEQNLGGTAFTKFQTDFRTVKNLCRRLTNGSQTAPGGTLGTARHTAAPPFA